eukprot:TRINITY_DN22090_c0_g3_i1.p1 TRINITY_DN22090_c0_g3~~TRINITY_DN22090_c0_g3_i1.p1  ORF type:complete len:302 (-),score=57.32 TRINITY_DN22090_c0_g3_i1:271-1176(-)
MTNPAATAVAAATEGNIPSAKRQRQGEDDEEEKDDGQTVMAFPDKPPEAWLTAINASFAQQFDIKLKPLTETIGVVRQEQSTMKATLDDAIKRITVLETRDETGSMTSTATSARTYSTKRSNRIEIKGWCDYNTRSEKGITRQQVMTLYNKLVASLDSALQDKVKEPIIYGSKNSNFYVVVDESVYGEILGCWREMLKDNMDSSTLASLHGQSPRSYKILRTAPWEDACAFWRPCTSPTASSTLSGALTCASYAVRQGTAPIRLAEVSNTNPKEIVWQPEAHTVLGLPSNKEVAYAYHKKR